MLQSLNKLSLARYITKQLNNFFPDSDISADCLAGPVEKAIKRAEHCFSKINNRYFFDGKSILFNHLNADQYAIFLYYLSSVIWSGEKDQALASKIYYLNKVLNGVDIFYEVVLPDVFLLVHPVGTVLGRCEYKDYFVAYQRVTVGASAGLDHPSMGEGVAMYGNSSIIGRCRIGDNCLISTGTIVMDKEIPSNVVVFGVYPQISFKPTKKSVLERYFII